MRKKILCAMLCIVIICTFAVQAMAAGASLSLSASSASRGNTVTVTVKLSGVGQSKAGSLVVSYGNGLEWTGATSKISGMNVDVKISEGRVVFYSMSDVNVDGNLIALTFKVKANAAFGNNTVSVAVNVNSQNLNASATVKVVCSHIFGKWSSSNATSHVRTCTVCGEKQTGNHGYDNACDTTCNSCGYKRTTTHNYGADWLSNESSHWHACTVCGAKNGETAHKPGEEAGEYTDQVCTDCGFVLTPALGHIHRYENPHLFDENGHWQICTGCEEATEPVSHVYDSDCDTVCDACTYERQVTHKEGQWEHDADSHWKLCTDCSLELERHDHEWDAGYVKERPTTETEGLAIFRCIVCMEEKQEVIPVEIPPVVVPEIADMFEWWGWLCVGAGAGVLITSLIFTIVLVAVRRRRNEREYYVEDDM